MGQLSTDHTDMGQVSDPGTVTDISQVSADPGTVTDIGQASHDPGTVTDMNQVSADRGTVTDMGQVSADPGTVTDMEQVSADPGTVTDMGQVSADPGTLTDMGQVSADPDTVTDMGHVSADPNTITGDLVTIHTERSSQSQVSPQNPQVMSRTSYSSSTILHGNSTSLPTQTYAAGRVSMQRTDLTDYSIIPSTSDPTSAGLEHCVDILQLL